MAKILNALLFPPSAVLCMVLMTCGSGCVVGAGEGEDGALVSSNLVAIDTPYGRMEIRLFDETPLHRDNFKRLAAEGFYNGTTFHRVMAGFMIQGGDPNSRDSNPDNDGQGGPGYTVPQEIHPSLLHKRGAVAAARMPDQVNPERASSGSQFYIVHGRLYPQALVQQFEEGARRQFRDPSFSYSEEEREEYTTVGGAPMLDGGYTVFGELVEGFEVLDHITRVATPAGISVPNDPNPDRPLTDVPMTVTPLSP